MSNSPIRIGTRDSKLAMWQAHTVARLLRVQNIEVEIIPVKSQGDIDTTRPLHELGTTGVFTKVLDDALFNNEIDIAVHSLKDYPTQPPAGIVLSAHLEREDPMDLFIPKGDTSFLNDRESVSTIGTGSIRRVAQWLHHFPNHTTENLRGNVQTRLIKLKESNWSGIIMASAGLRRMELVPENAVALDWMIPAPAQGVVGITHREGDVIALDACKLLDVELSRITSTVERQFLRTLEGGCSAPIGALARVSGQKIFFVGTLHSLDGKSEVKVEDSANLEDWPTLGEKFALRAKQNGGDAILSTLK
ncbi:hydroxymethylbilane synthase [Phaeocystidibacter marisrubri]|uniref:Hydroxymethylbilane synthase n=1 Tax=Phaeocystidibacter marisrubri TaxID=1577780 RepID=A0A6L3ZC52_9FLAO|nr:hydroxymethylbilane synthase [Phaeocystidibacter marisrubri]KAB2815244.1 hydroxymethylbilane synthase [Phaeocystidibacter marisrubri]GGH71081.1 hydroxymethylbilane synthase [Phaeocystidibacter marisrubri]